MGRPQQVTDEQIDAAARETFVRHGPGAAVALVADKLGVSHAALHQRTGSKENLLKRALSPRVPPMIEALTEAPPRTAKARRLEALLRDLLAFHESILPGIVVLKAGGLPAWPSGEEAPTLVVRRLLATWLRRAGIKPARATVLSEALLSSIEARCFNGYLGGEGFVAPNPNRFIHSLVTGLVPELGGRRS